MRTTLSWLLALLILAIACTNSIEDRGAISPTYPVESKAISIILLIGDGMGDEQRKAARWFSVGEDGELAMDRLPVSGWMGTSCLDSPITDSAAAATAMACGVKTNRYYVGMSADLDTLETILERARHLGRATGLVTTVSLSHATPAAFAAHVSHRQETEAIIGQMMEKGFDVLLGGGEQDFQPIGEIGFHPVSGVRTDDRDFLLEAEESGYRMIHEEQELLNLKPLPDRLLGVFADEAMLNPHPSLAAMTEAALGVLSADPDGFLLIVEGGQIDWACHRNSAGDAIANVLEFDAAVAVAVDLAARRGNILVIVAADHETGGMQVLRDPGGALEYEGPFTCPDLSLFYVTWEGSGHTATDVPVTAYGPGCKYLDGRYENTWLHDAMALLIENNE